MLDIEELKPLIVERLKSLQPSKIILFGSYAYGTPTDDSDIDLFLLKDDLDIKEMRNYKLELQKRLFDIVLKPTVAGFVDAQLKSERAEFYKSTASLLALFIAFEKSYFEFYG